MPIHAFQNQGCLKPGDADYRSAWIYETYAMDFVKEDIVWRNWHRTLSTDFMVGPERSWTSAYDIGTGEGEIPRIGGILDSTKSGELKPAASPEPGQNPGSRSQGPGSRRPAQGGFKDIKVVAYRSWTPDTLPQYKPKPPVPYRTFSETFSYVPPMPDNIREMLEREGMMY